MPGTVPGAQDRMLSWLCALSLLCALCPGSGSRSMEWFTALVRTEYTEPLTNSTVLGTTESGRYGDSSPKESVQGLVGFPRDPGQLEGCHPDVQYTVPGMSARAMEEEEPWIALVARGGCTFKDKVVNAARRKASAVVIYNEAKNGNGTVPMAHLGTDRPNHHLFNSYLSRLLHTQELCRGSNRVAARHLLCRLISRRTKGLTDARFFRSLNSTDNRHFEEQGTGNTVVIMVGYPKGMDIMELLRRNIPVKMIITVGTRHVQEFISGQSVVFVAIAFITMMIISLAWLIFYYIQRFLYTGNQYGNQGNRKETKKAINQLQLHRVKKGEKGIDIEAENCAVCIESYKPKDVVRILPCKHIFHRLCIDPWLLEHRTCPMCKLDVIKALGFWVEPEETLEIPVPESIAGSSLSVGTLSFAQEDNRSDINNLPTSSTGDTLQQCSSAKEDAGETTALLDDPGSEEASGEQAQNSGTPTVL
ncbi:E3 ubiquitin-protein ligase RNF149 isoform X2 [Ranitomeya imitator]|uniref:E3 ubiquitin-protein ligase RNF149 isoform X2 n=1 Tax=Ranitomeya imitator TaxID=111125 RepID=UPI0037E876E1